MPTRPLRALTYIIFGITLLLALSAVALLGEFLVGGAGDWSWTAFPLALLLVTGPFALVLFMSLRWRAQVDPAERRRAARRYVFLAVQLLLFLAMVTHTVVLLYLILSGHYSANASTYSGYDGGGVDLGFDDGFSGGSSGDGTPMLSIDICRWLITMLLAGLTYAYFWRDERRHG